MAAEISKIKSLLESLSPNEVSASKALSKAPEIPFDQFLDTALAIKDVMGENKGVESKNPQDLKFGIVNQKQFSPEVIESVSQRWVEPKSDIVAQVIRNSNPQQEDRLIAQIPDDFDDISSEDTQVRQNTILPFQVFIEKGVDLLGRISALEAKSDNLMEQYMAGKISVEEFTVVKSQVGVMLTFATNLLNQAVTVFKEIQGMQI